MQNKTTRRISVTFRQTIGVIESKSFRAPYSHLVIHTPHDRGFLPVYADKDLCVKTQYYRTGYKRIAIRNWANLIEDHFTDELFCTGLPEASQVSFRYSRVFCDVERMLDDPLEERGLGICYDLKRFLRWSLNEPIWKLSKEDAMNLYYEHHEALKSAIKENSLLLDCHSFSECDNVLCPNAHEYKDIDICLGYNEDKTRPDGETLDFVADFFRRKGYRVEFNRPFSNSKTVESEAHYHSLMIEVNKHCYMDEKTLEKTDGFEKLHGELNELYGALLRKV